jgi:hypothetical protein
MKRPEVGDLVVFEPSGDDMGSVDGRPARLPESERIDGEPVARVHAVVIAAGDELVVSRRVARFAPRGSGALRDYELA